MILFLTGPQGVGKSTALRRTLSLLSVSPGGFRTGYTPDRTRLCLWPAWEEPDWAEGRAVARMVSGAAVPDPSAFDRLGSAALAASRPWARLLLLDELGRLEREARAFQRAVRACLEWGLPVLGVVKPDRAGTWLEGLVTDSGVEVLTVTEANRDGLPALLAERLGPLLREVETPEKAEGRVP